MKHSRIVMLKADDMNEDCIKLSACVCVCFSPTWTQITEAFLQINMKPSFVLLQKKSAEILELHTDLIQHALHVTSLKPNLYRKTHLDGMIEAEEVHLYSRETEIIGTVQRSQLGPLPVTLLEVFRRTDGDRTLLHEHIRDRRDGQHGNDMRKRKPP